MLLHQALPIERLATVGTRVNALDAQVVGQHVVVQAGAGMKTVV